MTLTVNDVLDSGDFYLVSDDSIIIYALTTDVAVQRDEWKDDDEPLYYAFELYDGQITIAIQSQSEDKSATFILGCGALEINGIIYGNLSASGRKAITVNTDVDADNLDDALTQNFIDNELSANEIYTETKAINTLAIVTTLDYLNSDIFSDGDASSGGGDLLGSLMSIRSYLLSAVNRVYASENVTTGVYSLMQQTQLMGCVVRAHDQVSTHTDILNMGMFGSVDTIGNESVGNISSFSSNLNVDIASPLLDGAINIGKVVLSNF